MKKENYSKFTLIFTSLFFVILSAGCNSEEKRQALITEEKNKALEKYISNFSKEQLLYCPVVKVRKQNEAIANKYDRVSATLPKGTTERIKALGLSVNGLINKLVLAELERLENCDK